LNSATPMSTHWPGTPSLSLAIHGPMVSRVTKTKMVRSTAGEMIQAAGEEAAFPARG
jgi:hypothetical protein